MAAVQLNQSIGAWRSSARLHGGYPWDIFSAFRFAESLYFTGSTTNTTSELNLRNTSQNLLTQAPFGSPIEISVVVILLFFLSISHFLSSRPFLCFRFSHYRAAVMLLCSPTTLPPQKLIVWNYAVGCKSFLVHCNWLLFHWQWQLFLLSFTRHVVC